MGEKKPISTEEKTEELTKENTTEKLTDKDLDSTSGGAYPTSVNNQITDSVTQ